MAETEQTSTAGAQITAAQPAQQPATDGGNSSGSSNGATFTQAQLNEIVGKTRKEARDTAVSDVLKELGLATKDELKSVIEDARKLKQSQMSELEKANALLEAERKEKERLQAERDTERQQRRHDKIFAHIERAATTAKANDAETVLLYLKEKHGLALNEVMADDGTIDDKKVTALMDKVKTEKPVYFTPSTSVLGSQSNFGGRTTPSNQKPDVSKYRV